MDATARSRLIASAHECLTLYLRPGDWAEIRCIGEGGRALNGFYDFEHFGHAAEAALAVNDQVKACYFTPNPVNIEQVRLRIAAAGLTLRVNELGPCATGEGAADADILLRRWFLGDCDPRRPAGTSSTQTERDASRAVALECVDFLLAQGLAGPVFASSGNGFQHCWPCWSPNDDANRDLHAAALKMLDKRFSTGTVSCDTVNFNAARIWKLWGTQARKGSPSPERMHRYSRLDPEISPPAAGDLERLGHANYAALAAALATWQRSQAEYTKAAPKARPSAWDRASAYLATMPPGIQGQGGSSATYEAARAMVRGFDLGLEQGLQIMMREYNPRCVPPWPEKEMRHKCADADAKPHTQPRGWLLNQELPQAATVPTTINRATAKPSTNVANGHASTATPTTPVLTQQAAVEMALAGAGDVPDWPAPPDPCVYDGFIGQLVQRIEPQTEADPIAILLHLLTYFGNAAGRNAFRPVGKMRHYGNLFVALVGPTSMGGKGTAKSWADALFQQADESWTRRCVLSGLSSGEGLISAVRDRQDDEEEDIRDKRLCAVEEELGGVFRIAQRENNILSAVMRQAWDTGKLRTLTRANPLRATDVLISVLGHVTRDELLRTLSTSDTSNGLANRFLWACCKISKLLPDGGDDLDLGEEGRQLASLLERAAARGSLDRSREATEIWYEVYPRLRTCRPGVYGLVTARGAPQVLRLSLLYCLLDGRGIVEARDMLSALALWEYCDRSVAWIFSAGTGSDVADDILAALHDRGHLSLTEISGLFHRNRTSKELRSALQLLKAAGLATCSKRPPKEGGRKDVEVWEPTKLTRTTKLTVQIPQNQDETF